MPEVSDQGENRQMNFVCAWINCGEYAVARAPSRWFTMQDKIAPLQITNY